MNKLDSIIRGREAFTINQNLTVLEAARYMADKRIGAVAVLNDNRIVGVFSERDLMTRVVVAGRVAEQTRIADVMTQNIVTGSPDDTWEDGIRKMQQARCRHLPVVNDGKLLGFVSLRDLLQVEIAEKDEELKLMNQYVYSMPQ